jgi:hypothetical protein
VYRNHQFRCSSCRWWHTRYPKGECRYRARRTTVGEARTCRLCFEQARMLQEPGRAHNFAVANQYGQQLFLANMRFGRRPATLRLKSNRRRGQRLANRFRPAAWRQLALFHMDPDPEIIRARALTATSDLVAYCEDVVAGHSARHGWSKRQRNDVVRSLRLLGVLQDTPRAKINATDVEQLPRYRGSITSTLEVLQAAGLLNDDRPSHTERYFAPHCGQLPEPMKTQLETCWSSTAASP